jgi:hypothetical protein
MVAVLLIFLATPLDLQAGVAPGQVVEVASIMGTTPQLEEAVSAAHNEGYWLPPQVLLPSTSQQQKQQEQQQQAGKRRKSRSRRGQAGQAPFEPLSTVNSLQQFTSRDPGGARGSCGSYDSGWPLPCASGNDCGGECQDGYMGGGGDSCYQDRSNTCYQDSACNSQQQECMDPSTCMQVPTQQSQGACGQQAAVGVAGVQQGANARHKKRVHTAQERLAAVGMGLDPSALKLNAMQRLGIIANRGEAPSGPSARMQVRI